MKGGSRNSPSLKQPDPEIGDALLDEILVDTEGDGEDTSKHQSNDNRRGIPAPRDATPLSSKDEANSPSHGKDDTNPVTHEQLLEHGFGVALVRTFTTKGGSAGLEEEETADGDTTERQVDIETPSPADMV